MILRYRLRDLIKIYDDFVNDPIEGDFQKTLLLFQIGRKTLVEYNVSVTSKPDHPPPPPGRPLGNFLKERILYLRAQRKCESPTPGAEKLC